jgi:hypothetical protein
VPIPTKIKIKDFLKALEVLSERKDLFYRITNKRGSGRRFDIFKDKDSKIPVGMFVIHEAKVLYSKDLEKVCHEFDITEDEFGEIVDGL